MTELNLEPANEIDLVHYNMKTRRLYATVEQQISDLRRSQVEMVSMLLEVQDYVDAGYVVKFYEVGQGVAYSALPKGEMGFGGLEQEVQ